MASDREGSVRRDEDAVADAGVVNDARGMTVCSDFDALAAFGSDVAGFGIMLDMVRDVLKDSALEIDGRCSNSTSPIRPSIAARSIANQAATSAAASPGPSSEDPGV